MTYYPIHHPLIRLEMRLVELQRLSIHEEILPHALHRLVNDIRSQQCLMHPIIVDRKYLVVLDGMHRTAATQQLGCRFIPACLVDYRNPHVTVEAWYRVIHSSSSGLQIVKTLLSQQYRLKKHSLKTAQTIVENREALAALLLGSTCFTIQCPQYEAIQNDIQDVYRKIKELEYNLLCKGFSITYEMDTDAFTRLNTNEVTPILLVPTVTKQEVIGAALKNQLFYHKTTRHVIPLRPMFINTPLNWLHSTAPLNDMNQKFVEYLSNKSYRYLPPGQVLDRRYNEELYIFH